MKTPTTQHRPAWTPPGQTRPILPNVPGGTLIATDCGSHKLRNARAALWRDSSGALVFVDLDSTNGANFVDVVLAINLDDLEAKLRARSKGSEGHHPSAGFDDCDKSLLKQARAALAGGAA